ncbi:transposase [Pseudomonas sp. dw_358]|uniref:transposase n=1 Tax=Pseudomonas sp. dw_358 TaxID=2720083 RepID=UPI001BD6AF03|nr:transposase [Pseudomonas sp. dw_358]
MAHFTDWSGRTERSSDLLSDNLLKRVAATFNVDTPSLNTPLPPLWHWCFFQDPVGEPALGRDGHPQRGDFLPQADGRNRMWAGGRVEFIEPLQTGLQAVRASTIVRVEEKTGRSGKLLFVTVGHEYAQSGHVRVREEQDIVYREPTPPKLHAEPIPQGQWSEPICPTPTLLFRYSAATFNSHRIHYDEPYATAVEGYAGLVVHGPLIATLSLDAFMRAHPDARVRQFSFRNVRPLVLPDLFEVGGHVTAAGTAQLWAGNRAGAAQMAQVAFD